MKNDIRLFLLSLLLLLALPSRAEVTITVNSNGGSPFCDAGGMLLNTGCIVRVGFFDFAAPGNLLTLQTSNDFSVVDALFTPLGEGIAGAGNIYQAGSLTNYLIINGMYGSGEIFGQITGIDPSYFAAGTDLALWVYNNATPEAASEWGIFTATTRPNDNWDFPNDHGNSTLSTFEIDIVIRGNNTGLQFQLSPVPEPSGLLILLAAGGVLLRRRRCC